MQVSFETWKNIIHYKDRLFKNPNLFNFSKEDIVKKFFEEIFQIDIQKNFEEGRKKYVDFLNKEEREIPIDNQCFLDYIFNVQLELVETPKYELEILKKKDLEVRDKIIMLINKNNERKSILEERLQNKNDKISELNRYIYNKKKDFKDYSSEFAEKKSIAHNYIPLIEAEIEECNYFIELLNEKINNMNNYDYKKKAIECCQIRNDEYKYLLSDIELEEEWFIAENKYSIPIKFTRTINDYIKEVKKNSNNKNFQEIIKESYDKYEYKIDVLNDLKEKNIYKYRDKLKKNIVDMEVCKYINENIEKNHILNNRASVIKSAIKLFKGENYLSFINLVVVQIEGIFYDICEELGDAPDQVKSFTIRPKVDKLKGILSENGFPYFKFYFPLIRNKVAHGMLTEKEQIELIAYETMLDLQFIIYMYVNSDMFIWRRGLKLIKSFSERLEHIERCILTFLINGDINENFDYIMNTMYDEVHKFYDAKDIIRECKNEVIKIRKYIFEDNFLNYMEYQCIYNYKVDRNKYRKIVKLIDIMKIYCAKKRKEEKEALIALSQRVEEDNLREKKVKEFDFNR